MKIILELPEDITALLNEDAQNLADDIKLMAIIKMYELGKVSLGKAAEFLKVNETDFMEMLGEYQIPSINYSPHELDEELKTVNKFLN
jgi:predicted HTH domain antitoxin